MDDVSSFRYSKKNAFSDVSLRRSFPRIRYQASLQEKQELLNSHRLNPHSSVLFSRGKRRNHFFTADSKRYISPQERESFNHGARRYDSVGKFDSVHIRFIHPKVSAGELMYRRLQDRYYGIRNTIANIPELLSSQISVVKVWNASIVGAVLFGMFSMTMIYRYLGQQAFADSVVVVNSKHSIAANEVVATPTTPVVLGASTEKSEDDLSKVEEPVAPQLSQEEIDQLAFETKARDMVKGYPIEKMLPYIFKQDREVAIFLISIAKKESNWGKRVPVLDGQDCYNYWGYRGIRDKMGTGGHTCFNNPQDAVETVGKRLKTLVIDKKINTPKELIVWKCGSSCAGHSKQSVQKWISDVDMYWRALK